MSIMTFAELLAATNTSKHPRTPEQWTPATCQVWRDAVPEDAQLLEAAFAWELSLERIAKLDDEPAVPERRTACLRHGHTV